MQRKQRKEEKGTGPFLKEYGEKGIGPFLKEYGVRPYPEEAREAKRIKVAFLDVKA